MFVPKFEAFLDVWTSYLVVTATENEERIVWLSGFAHVGIVGRRGVAASHENIEAEGIFALISHEGDVSTRGNYIHRLPCRLRNCEEGDISALLVI